MQTPNLSLVQLNQAFDQLRNTVDGLRNQTEVMEHVLRVVVASHPQPEELQRMWHETSSATMERVRPKTGHIGMPTREDWLYQTFRKWSDIIQSAGKAAG